MAAGSFSNLISESHNSNKSTRCRGTRAVMIFLLTCQLWGNITMTNGYGMDPTHREALMWRCEEWSVENTSWSGNPFDVIASVTFVHSSTGEQRTTHMFYAGDNQWKFRFTGTRTGEWRFSTSSDDTELHGHTGTVTVKPRANPQVKGFLTHVGNKYAIMEEDIDHLQGYV